MRLFATGAMNWVMSRALPDDVPIEAKMVTKAIERAQNTVEARNSEIRKDVLKYDEVMDKQRKAIYGRRMQILDGDDLRDETLEILDEAMNTVVEEFCGGEFTEDWDVEGLLRETSGYYPTQFTAEELNRAVTPEELVESLVAEATSYYERREEAITPEVMRQLEREIMLQIIDQRWREHLAEMDYLREGIGLRAMGQQDPLNAWQSEGYDMFMRMMGGIKDDYLRYVMHAEVIIEAPEQPSLEGAQYKAAEDTVQRPGLAAPAPIQGDLGDAFAAAGAQQGLPTATAEPAFDPNVTMTPVVRSEHDKVGRNDPCWCGSGKKFKHCHGR